jgi:leucine dehydrogenase
MKDIFKYLEEHSYEQMIFFANTEVGLKGITCIHNTVLGPSCGGTRFYNYETTEDALYDVTRLARGMTYKNAASGLNLGGCKTVIVGDPKKLKSEAFFRAYGRHIQSLNGRVITGEDMNISPDDCVYMNMECDYIAGLPGKSGDPSIVTALGVYVGMKASAKQVYGDDSLKGLKVSIQGAGQVGYYLAKHLEEEGANIFYTDISEDRINRMKTEFKDATYVDPKDIYGLEVDIFSPCAMGAIFTDETIPQLKCKIIAGSANNVLQETRHGDKLDELGILYAPDYVINAGGVINVYHEVIGYNHDRAINDASKIYDRLLEIYKIAEEEHIPTYLAADRMAERRIEAVKHVTSNHIKR